MRVVAVTELGFDGDQPPPLVTGGDIQPKPARPHPTAENVIVEPLLTDLDFTVSEL